MAPAGTGQPEAAPAAPVPALLGAGAATPNLVFDGTSFESANLASAKLVSLQPAEYDLYIRPDTMNSRHRIWFYYSVRGARAGQKVIFNLVGYSKTKSLFREGMAPVVCSSGRPYWERMPPNSVYYYRSPRHDKQYVLSFPFCFERADETYYFALSFPYTYSYLQRFLFELEAKALPFLHRETLCRTLQERRCDLLTISSPANLKLDYRPLPHLLCKARLMATISSTAFFDALDFGCRPVCMNDLGLRASHGSHVFAGSGVWRSLRDVPGLDQLDQELQKPNPEWLDWMGYGEDYGAEDLFDALEHLEPAVTKGITHFGYPTNTQSSFNQLRVGAEAAICTADWRGAADLLSQAAQMRPQHRGVARRLAAVSCRNPLLRWGGLILTYRDLG